VLAHRGDGPDAGRIEGLARRAYGYAIRDNDRAGFTNPGTDVARRSCALTCGSRAA
jgi:hypothetical protein